MDLRLAGQTALITGASKGIGEGLAHAFAAEGVHLALVARSGDTLDALAARLMQEHGIKARTLAIDVTAAGAIETIAEFAGDVDILVNNAGAIPGGDLWQVDDAAWRAGWELKVFGYINLVRAMYPRMKRRGTGVIINNIGNGGENPDFNYIAGSTGNAALMAFTRAIGGASMDDGIRVVGVNPGPVATDRIQKLLEQRATANRSVDDIIAAYPGGRVASVEETADLIVFLASPRSSYTSGTIATIDGGISSRSSIG